MDKILYIMIGIAAIAALTIILAFVGSRAIGKAYVEELDDWEE